MVNKNSDDNFKGNLIIALVGGLFILFSVLAGYILTRLSTLDEIARTHGERIARLETCVDCSKSPRTKIKGGYEWKEYPSEETDESGAVTFSVEIDVLSKQYRWACGRSNVDDIVRENQANSAVSLEDIIRKYDPDDELRDAKKIVVVGTASSEGDLVSQEDLAQSRARTLLKVVGDNLQKKIPVIGMSFGQYVADKEKAKCSDATSEQRRVLIVKLIKQSTDMSDYELEKSLIKRFEQLAEKDSYKFPIDIRDYSNYKDHKRMFLEY